MSDEAKKVPIAYVTKWATTAGILVVRDAETYADGWLGSRRSSFAHSIFVGPKHWTTDRGIAEERWGEAIRKAIKAAERKVAKLKSDAAAGPKVTER